MLTIPVSSQPAPHAAPGHLTRCRRNTTPAPAWPRPAPRRSKKHLARHLRPLPLARERESWMWPTPSAAQRRMRPSRGRGSCRGGSRCDTSCSPLLHRMPYNRARQTTARHLQGRKTPPPAHRVGRGGRGDLPVTGRRGRDWHSGATRLRGQRERPELAQWRHEAEGPEGKRAQEAVGGSRARKLTWISS